MASFDASIWSYWHRGGPTFGKPADVILERSLIFDWKIFCAKRNITCISVVLVEWVTFLSAMIWAVVCFSHFKSLDASTSQVMRPQCDTLLPLHYKLMLQKNLREVFHGPYGYQADLQKFLILLGTAFVNQNSTDKSCEQAGAELCQAKFS